MTEKQAKPTSDSKSTKSTDGPSQNDLAATTETALTGDQVARATVDARRLTSGDVMMLQRTIGNHAVGQLLGRKATPPQPKMTVGPASDAYESEADKIANQVVRSPEVQRAAYADTSQPQVGPEGGHADQALESRIRKSKSGGSAMPGNVRSTLESKFGADFSQVKVHTDRTSVQLNRDLGAKAFTHKNHIYFGAGHSPSDLDLTAHEAVHTIQQGAVPQKGGSVLHRSVLPRSVLRTSAERICRCAYCTRSRRGNKERDESRVQRQPLGEQRMGDGIHHGPGAERGQVDQVDRGDQQRVPMVVQTKMVLDSATGSDGSGQAKQAGRLAVPLIKTISPSRATVTRTPKNGLVWPTTQPVAREFTGNRVATQRRTDDSIPEITEISGSRQAQTNNLQRGFFSTLSRGAQHVMGGLGALVGGIVGLVVAPVTGALHALGVKGSPGVISTIQGGARLGSRITTAPWRTKGNLGEANKKAAQYNAKIIDPREEDRSSGYGEASAWQQKELDGILQALKVYEVMLSTDSRYKTPQAIEWARQGIVNTGEYTFGKVRSQLHDDAQGKYQGSGMTNAYTDTDKNHITVCGDNLLRSFGSGTYDVELEKGIAVHELAHMLLSHEVKHFHTMVDTYYSSGEKPAKKGNMWDVSKGDVQGEGGGYKLRHAKASGYEKAVTKYGGSNPEDDLCETARYYFQSEALKTRLRQVAPGRYWAFEQIVAHNMNIASDEWLRKHQKETNEARVAKKEPVDTSREGVGVGLGAKIGLDVGGDGPSSGKPSKPLRKDKKPSKPPRKGGTALERYGHLVGLVSQLKQSKKAFEKLVADSIDREKTMSQPKGKAGRMMVGTSDLAKERELNQAKIRKIEKLLTDIENKAKLDLKALQEVLISEQQIPSSGKQLGKDGWTSPERMEAAGTGLMGPGTDLMGSH